MAIYMINTKDTVAITLLVVVVGTPQVLGGSVSAGSFKFTSAPGYDRRVVLRSGYTYI